MIKVEVGQSVILVYKGRGRRGGGAPCFGGSIPAAIRADAMTFATEKSSKPWGRVRYGKVGYGGKW